MKTALSALDRIDNTICLNNLKGNIEWNIDKVDFCDCLDINEFVEDYEVIDRDLTAFDIVKPFLRVSQDDCGYWLWLGMNAIPLKKEDYEFLKEVLKEN